MFEQEESLRELYHDMIIEHGRHPRHRGALPSATSIKTGHNPLCGDHLVLQLKIEGGLIVQASFEGHGCAISMASTSLMLERLQGMSIHQAKQLFAEFHQVMFTDVSADDAEHLEKLVVLAGVKAYPSRVKCATLCWQTLDAMLTGDEQDVSTE